MIIYPGEYQRAKGVRSILKCAYPARWKALRARACAARLAGNRGTTSVAQVSPTREGDCCAIRPPVSWRWTSMVLSCRWWLWSHNTMVQEDYAGLGCPGSYA